jgi:DUF971 family protein
MDDSDQPPHQIRVNEQRDRLTLVYADGVRLELAAEYLRVESPSAEVQGHGAGQKKLVTGKQNVRIKGIKPVGHYAIKIIFSDGHDTGLFTWRYLRELDQQYEKTWAAYLAQLAERGIVR